MNEFMLLYNLLPLIYVVMDIAFDFIHASAISRYIVEFLVSSSCLSWVSFIKTFFVCFLYPRQILPKGVCHRLCPSVHLVMFISPFCMSMRVRTISLPRNPASCLTHPFLPHNADLQLLLSFVSFFISSCFAKLIGL